MDTLPQNIRVGMKVFDSRHKEVGKIDDLKFPENALETDVEPADIDGTDKSRHETIIDDIAKAFSGDEMPEVLRDRLLREGYIRLDANGLFAADRYVLPSQIASASGNEVTLNVEKDELIKRH